MVKKLQKMADKKKAAPTGAFAALPAGLLDSAMAHNVKDSAQQIWAAGLASFSKAQGEGTKVFESLVSEGLKLQKKTQSAAEERFGAVASKVTGMAGDVGAKAGQHWDKLEGIFEQRVAKALKTLGVPSAGDVDSLIKRIDALAVSVGIKKPSPVTKPVATAAKAVVKKAAAVKKAVIAKAAPKAAPKASPVAAAKKAVVKKAAAVEKAIVKKAAPVKAAAKAAVVKTEAAVKTTTRRVAKKAAATVAAVEASITQA
jgi:poly(hydroxyalkanoate) granule-associated protein